MLSRERARPWPWSPLQVSPRPPGHWEGQAVKGEEMPTGPPGEAGLTLHAPRADMSLIQGCVADPQAMSLHGALDRTESQESPGSGQEALGLS